MSGYESFWVSSYFGRFTLPEWLHLSTGATLVGVVLMAVGAFAFAGWVEQRQSAFLPVGGAPPPPWMPRARRGGAALLVLAAVLVAVRGQPTPDQKWARAAPALHQLVAQRAVFADPAEVVALKQDTSVLVDVVDLRSEHDFNLFHVGGSRRVPPAELDQSTELKWLLGQPSTTVTFLIGNGEQAALLAWERLKGEGVSNVYVVEGGSNHWLEVYPPPGCVAERVPAGADDLAWRFSYAAGANLPSAWPELPVSREFRFGCDLAAAEQRERWVWPARAFTKKVKLQSRAMVKGGCG